MTLIPVVEDSGATKYGIETVSNRDTEDVTDLDSEPKERKSHPHYFKVSQRSPFSR